MSSATVSMPMRILLVGMQRLYCDALHLLLDADHDLAVVGKTICASEAHHCYQSLHPHLILADLDLPDGINMEFAEQLSQLFADVPIAILTMYIKPNVINQLLQLNIQACLAKDIEGEELITTLKLLKNRGGAKDFVIFDY